MRDGERGLGGAWYVKQQDHKRSNTSLSSQHPGDRA